MLLNPRYDGPAILSMTGPSDDVLEPLMRQRRRLAATLGTLTEQQWQTPSRCAGWTVRDVVAHLAGINPLYQLSALCGLAGKPTQLMVEFDPAATPPIMVAGVADQSSAQVLSRFVSTNEEFFTVVEGLDDAGWSTTAESPVGHVAIRFVCLHALWDSWVHERDIALPLNLTPPVEPDEVAASLRYAAALGPAFGMGAGHTYGGRYAVEATNPAVSFIVDIDTSVHIREHESPRGIPVLRGEATQLVEALSTRHPLASVAREWRELHNGLRETWDLELDLQGS